MNHTVSAMTIAAIVGLSVPSDFGRGHDTLADNPPAPTQPTKAKAEAVQPTNDGKPPAEPTHMIDPKKAMEAWRAAMAAGREHKRLEALVGEWTCRVSLMDEKGEPVMRKDGAARGESIHGGRFVRFTIDAEELISETGPYSAQIVWGYNNILGRYETVWTDNLSTASAMGNGTYDSRTRSFTIGCDIDQPIAPGKTIKMKQREVTKVESSDLVITSVYAAMPGESEKQTMELRFSRKPPEPVEPAPAGK